MFPIQLSGFHAPGNDRSGRPITRRAGTPRRSLLILLHRPAAPAPHGVSHTIKHGKRDRKMRSKVSLLNKVCLIWTGELNSRRFILLICRCLHVKLRNASLYSLQRASTRLFRCNKKLCIHAEVQQHVRCNMMNSIRGYRGCRAEGRLCKAVHK